MTHIASRFLALFVVLSACTVMGEEEASFDAELEETSHGDATFWTWAQHTGEVDYKWRTGSTKTLSADGAVFLYSNKASLYLGAVLPISAAPDLTEGHRVVLEYDGGDCDIGQFAYSIETDRLAARLYATLDEVWIDGTVFDQAGAALLYWKGRFETDEPLCR